MKYIGAMGRNAMYVGNAYVMADVYVMYVMFVCHVCLYVMCACV